MPYGYEHEAAEIQDLYLSGRKKEAEAVVPPGLLDGLSLIGTEGFVRDRIAAHKAAGVTWLDVTPIGPDPLRRRAAGERVDRLEQLRNVPNLT